MDFLPQKHPCGSQYSGYWAPVENPQSFVQCLNHYFCQKTLGLRAFQAQTGKKDMSRPLDDSGNVSNVFKNI